MNSDIDQYCHESASAFETIPDVHPDDFIYKFVLGHPRFSDPRDAVSYYFSDGRNSARTLREILSIDLEIAPSTSLSLLEFASGYGCVTRHLPKMLPNVSIVASDIHPQANEFVRQKMGVNTVQSASVPEEFPKGSLYDVIFVLSFFSHMPKKTWGRWLKVLSDQLKVNGYLIFTTHGLTSARKVLPDLQFDEEGFSFHEASEQDDLGKAEYGTTAVTPFFVVREAELLDNCQVRLFKGGFWWRLQDLWVIEKIPSDLVPIFVQTEDIPDGPGAVGHFDVCSPITHKGINSTRIILLVNGWVVPTVSAKSVADEVAIIINLDDGSRYVAVADQYNRPDISNAYSNPGLLKSGFKAKIDMGEFKSSGTVRVAMRYNGQWATCRMSEKRIVR
jgi:hypothetical protein